MCPGHLHTSRKLQGWPSRFQRTSLFLHRMLGHVVAAVPSQTTSSPFSALYPSHHPSNHVAANFCCSPSNLERLEEHLLSPKNCNLPMERNASCTLVSCPPVASDVKGRQGPSRMSDEALQNRALKADRRLDLPLREVFGGSCWTLDGVARCSRWSCCRPQGSLQKTISVQM